MPTVDATRQHYEVWGDPAHPAVILVHGLRAYGRWFEPVAQALQARCWVIAPDLRGRNLSPWAADGDYSIDAYVQDLAALADHCGVDRFALGGHSLGGTIIANFIQRFPERVAAAILFDASPEADPAGVIRIKSEVARTPPRFGSMEEAARFLRALHPRASEADFAIRLHSMLGEDAAGGVQFRIDPACTRQPPAPAVESWAAFGSIRCPTLQLRGAESDILSRAQFERIRALLPDCENVEIPAAAHMVVEDNPALRQRLSWRFCRRPTRVQAAWVASAGGLQLGIISPISMGLAIAAPAVLDAAGPAAPPPMSESASIQMSGRGDPRGEWPNRQ